MCAVDASREDTVRVSVEQKRALLGRRRKLLDSMVTRDDATMPDKKRGKKT